MRVISGIYRSRILKGYDDKLTRPTMDRIKESMFAMINSYIKDSTCLDLFAGSGSLGIEAISNKAKEVYFNDNSSSILKVLKENINTLKITSATVLNLDYMSCLNKLKSENLVVDIIFIDAPYHMNVISNILNYTYENNILSPNGIIVYEHDKYQVENNNYNIIKEKKFKDIIVTIYQIK